MVDLVLQAPERGKPPRHLLDLSRPERRAAMSDLGLPAFRADQVSTHLLTHLQNDPDEWTDISAPDRATLRSVLPELLQPVRTLTCDDGATVKTLYRLHDGSLVESVLMRYPDRVTMCISSQAGCGMNCPFCATGQAGLTRNLSTAEIVEQVLAGARALANNEIPGGSGSNQQRRVHGYGGAARQLPHRDRDTAPTHRPCPRRAGNECSWRHGVDRRSRSEDSGVGRGGGCPSRWRSPCTHRMIIFETPWCR